MTTPWITPAPVQHDGVVKAAYAAQSLRNNMSLSMHMEAQQGGDHTQTSNTVLIDSPQLFLNLAGESLYFVHVLLWYSAGGAGPNIKIGFKGPSDCDIHLRGASWNESGVFTLGFWSTPQPTTGITQSYNWLASSGSFDQVEARGLVYTVTAGAFNVQWAQANSSVTGTTVQGASHIYTTYISSNPGLTWE